MKYYKHSDNFPTLFLFDQLEKIEGFRSEFL